MKKLILLVALTSSCAGEPVREPKVEVQVYHLKRADATRAVRTLAGEEWARATPGMEMAADARTNSVIVKAPRSALERIANRIRELDCY